MIDVKNAFVDHGVVVPISNHRGIVATVDGDGRNVVLVWLFDHRGGYALLMIDAATGRTREIPVPFPPGGDCPFSSILSSRNRFYTHFNSYFAEFDPVARSFTFHHSTAPQMAMGMTEDDNGLIWSVTYPKSGIVSFDPETREFRDYGYVHDENWNQYQRFVAADDAGWVYFGLGNTASQIIAFDPVSGDATPILPEKERVIGNAYVYRDMNGKVYGLPLNGMAEGWYECHAGKATRIDNLGHREEKPIITSSQGLFHRDFPDGRQLESCDLVDRVMVVKDPQTGKAEKLEFDYSSDGAHIMGLAVAPDDTICGGTSFPMRFFRYDPKDNGIVNREAFGQFNTVVRQGDRFFVGGYTGGFLLEWNPAREWVRTEKDRADSNPRLLTQCKPPINRPHDLLAHSDGKTIVMAGTPDYGYTGGGLLFWDRETSTRTFIEHTEILPDHSTMSLVTLPGGKLLGGSTTDAGTGGERKASQAELYIMDMKTKRIDWHEIVLPDVAGYVDMCLAPSGLVYGIADAHRFFVFDHENRKVIHEEDTASTHGPTGYQQGCRKFVAGADGAQYILFLKGIVRVNPATFKLDMLAESPVPVQFGGDILDGRIYFGSGSHLYSCGITDCT